MDKYEESLDRAEASLKIEGGSLSSEDRKLILQKARGEITHEQFLERAKELATSKK